MPFWFSSRSAQLRVIVCIVNARLRCVRSCAETWSDDLRWVPAMDAFLLQFQMGLLFIEDVCGSPNGACVAPPVYGYASGRSLSTCGSTLHAHYKPFNHCCQIHNNCCMCATPHTATAAFDLTRSN